MRVPYRWTVLIGCFIAYLFDSLEIVILALTLPDMRNDLGLSVTQGGLMATATLLGIGLSAVVSGWFSDRYGRKRPLLFCLALFGALTVSVAFINDLELILLVRFASGFGLGGVWAIVCAYVVETWPPHHRGRAVAFVMSAFPLGTTVAAILARLLLPDWRMMFILAGAGVIIPIAIVALFFRESVEWTNARSATVAQPAGQGSAMVRIFDRDNRRVTFFGTIVCSFALIGYWGASTWIPTFLHEAKGLPMSTVAVFMTVLSLGSFVGYNGFGWISDTIGRKNAIIVSLAGTGLVLPFYAFATGTTALLLLGPLFAFFAAFTALFGSYFAEIFPADIRATGAGFCYNTGRGLSAFAPFALGYLATVAGFSGGFLICAGFFIAAAAVTMFLPRSRETDSKSTVATQPTAPQSPPAAVVSSSDAQAGRHTEDVVPTRPE